MTKATNKRRTSAQTKKSSAPPAKKPRASKPRPIPKKLPGEMNVEELDASARESVRKFFSSVDPKKVAARAATEAAKPFYLPPSVLRRKVEDEDKKWRDSRKPSPLSDFDRTLHKEVDPRRKKKSKSVPQLGETSSRPLPELVTNQYGSNTGYLKFPAGAAVDFDQLFDYYVSTGMDMSRVVFENAEVVDKWRKYEWGQSLWDPEKYAALGTQMYALNKRYLEACDRGERGFYVRIRDQWGRGDDVMWVEFSELHQLFYRDSLDKTIISCYCL
jgi:hypothetical protein